MAYKYLLGHSISCIDEQIDENNYIYLLKDDKVLKLLIKIDKKNFKRIFVRIKSNTVYNS